MKLIRFGPKGLEAAGIVDGKGIARDVSRFVKDWTGATVTDDLLAKLRAIPAKDFPKIDPTARIGAPIGTVGKVIGIALTYGKHAAEAGEDIPIEPMFMMISRAAINGPFDDVMMPRGGTELDWEAELGVVISKGGSYIDKEDALDHIAGYCVANDVSERQFQLERGSQWTKGKSAPTLKPIGPWLVTKDEIPAPNTLDISMHINGTIRQDSNTSDMMYSPAELVSYISNYVEWEAGDVMLTGTPPGVGYGMKPPLYMKPGDIMEPKIAGLGAQRSKIIDFQ